MEFSALVEALLFASPDPVSSSALARCLRQNQTEGGEGGGGPGMVPGWPPVTPRAIEDAIARLNRAYEEQGRAFRIVEEAGGWRFLSHPDFAPWIERLLPEKKSSRLSPAALETLAIIAYRQPITKSGVEEIRGVGIDGVLQTVLDRGLVQPVGRAPVPGRPVLYGTTERFLEHFGIPDLASLPQAGGLRVSPPGVPGEPGAPSPPSRQGSVPWDRPGDPGAHPAPERLSPVAAARKLAESQKKQPAASPGGR